jgi:GDP-L-fucose synthase
VFSCLKNSRILVTGGTGLIGRAIIKILCDNDAEVTSVSLDDLVVDKRAKHVKLDLTHLGNCLDITKDVDYVFHLAGIKGSIEVTKSKPASFFVPLLMFNTNVLEACRINKVTKVVFTSSIGAYPSAEIFKEPEIFDPGIEQPPMDMFPGWAKRMAEMQILAYKKQYGLDNFAIVRPCNVYGPGDNFDPENAMVVPSLMSRIANGESPLRVWGDGSAVRDFAYSEDVAIGVIQALISGTNDGFVNLGSGVGCSVHELVETLQQIVDFEYEFDTTKPNGFPKRVMDITKARETIGYEPKTTLKEGLQATWDWFMANREEFLKRQNYFN